MRTTDGTYAYDAFSRLVQRVVSNVGPAGTTQYLYDESGHVIVETDGAGNSLREYIWLDDLPVAIIDQVNTASPVLYYVHADHLNRPIMVTDSTGASVWQAIWTPFGAPQAITGTLTYDARFPGQWFQIESGLNWNWNRHYDPSTGRYVQVDPVGLATLLSDRPSVYAYARSSPNVWVDPSGNDPVAPYNPPDPSIPGGPWKWSPDEGNSRGGAYTDPNGNIASWDREGKHWDCDDPTGKRQRYSWRGAPLDPNEAHNPGPYTPTWPPLRGPAVPPLIPSVVCSVMPEVCGGGT
ncbi:RHS repeat-associated core domain-containing protein [Methylocapsa sp. S129]|uniref:RHS repeat-associated core domain-containing protein n=1 Tax=Methylocapsa sp. S129 TaxID=1641869 RepID=UPI00131D2F59|nr:RHS repeat-associated core domain-containing protein [Methylocapsa sp. S129]